MHYYFESRLRVSLRIFEHCCCSDARLEILWMIRAKPLDHLLWLGSRFDRRHCRAVFRRVFGMRSGPGGARASLVGDLAGNGRLDLFQGGLFFCWFRGLNTFCGGLGVEYPWEGRTLLFQRPQRGLRRTLRRPQRVLRRTLGLEGRPALLCGTHIRVP